MFSHDSMEHPASEWQLFFPPHFFLQASHGLSVRLLRNVSNFAFKVQCVDSLLKCVHSSLYIPIGHWVINVWQMAVRFSRPSTSAHPSRSRPSRAPPLFSRNACSTHVQRITTLHDDRPLTSFRTPWLALNLFGRRQTVIQKQHKCCFRRILTW